MKMFLWLKLLNKKAMTMSTLGKIILWIVFIFIGLAVVVSVIGLIKVGGIKEFFRNIALMS